jgi:hypothetical protein
LSREAGGMILFSLSRKKDLLQKKKEEGISAGKAGGKIFCWRQDKKDSVLACETRKKKLLEREKDRSYANKEGGKILCNRCRMKENNTLQKRVQNQ